MTQPPCTAQGNPGALALPAGSWGVVLACLALGAAAPVCADAVRAAAHRSTATDAGQLAGAIAALRSMTTMRADFVQTDSNGQQVRGVLTIKRPGMFRFQYQPGYPLLIVSDRRALAMIDYELHQVWRWPLSYTPVGALLDPRRDVSGKAQILPTGDPDLVSMLLRDRAHREAGDMTLTLVRDQSAPGGLALAGWAIVDAQNRRTIVRVFDRQYGIAVSDDTFTWIDPRKRARH